MTCTSEGFSELFYFSVLHCLTRPNEQAVAQGSQVFFFFLLEVLGLMAWIRFD